MSNETFSPPLKDEAWVTETRRPVNQLYLFMKQLFDLFVLYSQGIFTYKRYANLAAVQAAIPSPIDGMTVMFTGQGLGTYNESAGQWRLSSDDTTLVT